jgi:hypothetical protein
MQSNVIIAQNPLLQPLVGHRPSPSSSRFAAKQALRRRRLLEHTVFLHTFDLVASGVREEVLEVLILKRESIARDT